MHHKFVTIKTHGICFRESASASISEPQQELQSRSNMLTKGLSLKWQENPCKSSSTVLPPCKRMAFANTYFKGTGTRYSRSHEPRGDKPFRILAWVPLTHYLRESTSQAPTFSLQGKALQGQQFQGSKSVQVKGHSGSCSSYCTKEMHKLGAKKKRFYTGIYINICKCICVYMCMGVF